MRFIVSTFSERETPSIGSQARELKLDEKELAHDSKLSVRGIMDSIRKRYDLPHFKENGASSAGNLVSVKKLSFSSSKVAAKERALIDENVPQSKNL